MHQKIKQNAGKYISAGTPLAYAAPVAWIDKSVRMPTKEDADETGCVMVWHRYNKAMPMRPESVASHGSLVSHWFPMPAPPV